MSRFVLGLDPGTHFAGYALIEVRRPGLYRAQAMGTIVMRDAPLHRRLAQVMGELLPILEDASKHNAECVVERPFVNKNHMATLAIAGVRAICLALVGGAELQFHEYSPQTWKRITGKGNAQKIEVANAVKRILDLDFDPPLDAADAAGMAIFHAHTS